MATLRKRGIDPRSVAVYVDDSRLKPPLPRYPAPNTDPQKDGYEYEEEYDEEDYR
jgi:hypothetical protein